MTDPAKTLETPPVILCVEDEEDLRRDIADELAEGGYAVIEARNGQEALNLLCTSRPDLILCDISMPGLNGYEMLKAVQAKGGDYADVPFVFLSALADPREIVEGKRFGADDYLVKPVDYDLLLATVHARLRQIDRLRTTWPAPLSGINDEALASGFAFTAAEMRVALALTEGKSLSLIATEFGVSRTTVAFHMRNIYQKTGTNRQVELVSLLLSGPAPVRD